MAAPRLVKKEEPHLAMETYLMAAMKASIDGIAIINPDTTYRFVNKSYAHIHGYETHELIGRSWRMLHPPDEVFRLEAVIAPIAKKERHWRGESVGLRKNGSRFPQEISLTQISDDNEDGLMSVLRDITYHKKLETQLRLYSLVGKTLAESEDYDDTLKRCANLTIPQFADACVITLGDQTGLIEKVVVGANRELSIFNSLLSDLPFKISDRHCYKRVHQTQDVDYVEKVPSELLNQLFSDPRVHQEFEDLEIQSYIVAPLCVRDHFLGAIGFFRTRWRDLNLNAFFDPEEVEVALEITNRMAFAVDNARLLRETKNAVRSREDLMASVSHDLKCPLSSISVNAEMINRIAQDSPKRDKFTKLSDTIRISVERMMSLIRELLEIEKLRGGLLTVERKPIRVDELIEAALAVFSSLAKQKGIKIIRDLPLKPIWLHGDRERLLQALSNLLTNSLKFTPQGGTIGVSIKPLDREVQFCVSDTGNGIDPIDLPHIFERYYQAKVQTKKSATEGTGLGLSITRAIIEAHGGSIWAESKQGLGSKFFFTIPL